MRLEVHERLAALALLPTEGDYEALKTLRRAREMLSFTPEEMKLLEMINKVSGDGKPAVQWNKDKAADAVKDCPVDEYTTNVIRNALAKLDKTKKLTDQYLSLYEKFVIAYK